MMVTVDVPPELAAKLTEEAEGAGLSLDQYMLRIAIDHSHPGTKSGIGVPSFDPYLAAAGIRIRAAAAELERLGITDRHGNLLRTETPEDMKEGADRDFGG